LDRLTAKRDLYYLDGFPSEQRLANVTRMLQPADVAACVWLVASLPKFVDIEELLVRPLGNKTSQAGTLPLNSGWTRPVAHQVGRPARPPNARERPLHRA